MWRLRACARCIASSSRHSVQPIVPPRFRSISSSGPSKPPANSSTSEGVDEYNEADDVYEDGEYDQQEPFAFDLPDPDLAPEHGFGLRADPKVRSAYPAKIVWKPVEEVMKNDDEEYIEEEEEDQDQEAWLEAEKRKRKTEAKRLQRGNFRDHIVIKARGGKGGSGLASFGIAVRSGGMGAPAGGNGGLGGTVYITTTRALTSLHTVRRKWLGGQGGNGGAENKHGPRGEDVLIEVPVGTVVREIIREGDEEKHWEQMEEMEIPMEDRVKIRRERWFTVQSGYEMDGSYFAAAERLLRRERKWGFRTPTFEEQPPIIYDLDADMDEPIALARGGQGGMGNPFFTGLHKYKAPRLGSRGVMPYTSTFELELKLLADVGLVGFPNTGKSTILRALTGRRAEVADYSFTTLNPQVGVVRVWNDGSYGGGENMIGGENGVVEDTWKERERDAAAREQGEYVPLPRAGRVRSVREMDTDDEVKDKLEAYRYTISDNPGLLPQASENVGLGHSFLRSIERSLALAYVLDLTRPDPASDLRQLRTELETYKPGLAAKGAVVIINKADKVDQADGQARAQAVREAVAELPESADIKVMVLSGKYGLGLEKLVDALGKRVEREREAQRLQAEQEEDDWDQVPPHAEDHLPEGDVWIPDEFRSS